MKPWTGREILQDFSDEPKVVSEPSINSDITNENIPKTEVIPSTSASESTTALKTSQLKEQLKISFDKKRLERRKRPEESETEVEECPNPRRSQRSTKGKPPERLNYALFCFALIFNVLSVNAVFNSAPPILWHNSRNPIVKGIEVIYMKVYYEKPCSTFKQMMALPTESIDNFMQWCEKSFDKDFIEPLNKFCAIHDKSKPFPLIRRKRIAPLVAVGILALFVTVVTGIGLGSAAVYKTGKHEERISILEDNIKRITENEKLVKEALEFMQSDIEK